MAAAGWLAVNVDQRGHGESEWSPDGIYDLDRFAGDAAAVASGFDRPVLIGASLGGISALTAIGESTVPIASALVLVDITTRPDPRGIRRIQDFMRLGVDGFSSIDEVADAVSSYLPHRPRPRDLSGLAKNVRQREDGRWIWHWDPRFFENVSQAGGEPTAGSFSPPERLDEAARHVTIPTLLVRGADSDIVSEDGAQELRRLIPHADVVDVAGAGHMVAGDRNDRFTAAVLEFLSTLRP